MLRFRNILVGVDLSGADRFVVDWPIDTAPRSRSYTRSKSRNTRGKLSDRPKSARCLTTPATSCRPWFDTPAIEA